MKAVIGIGTNIGNREENIKNAIASVNLVPDTKVVKLSKIYETEPWGYSEQDKFLNCAVMVETIFSPQALLGVCLGIEAAMGRLRMFKNGPRVIDLDLLFYEDARSDTKELKLPHPEALNRSFVLAPLNDLFSDKTVLGYNFENSYNKCDFSSVSLYNDLIIKNI